MCGATSPLWECIGPLWESVGRLRRPLVKKNAEAVLRLGRMVRCDPGLRSIDRPEPPLTPNPLPLEVGYIRLRHTIRHMRCPPRVNPTWVGEDTHRRLCEFSIFFQTSKDNWLGRHCKPTDRANARPHAPRPWVAHGADSQERDDG